MGSFSPYKPQGLIRKAPKIDKTIKSFGVHFLKVFSLDLKLENSASELYSKWLIGKQVEIFLKFDKGPEFGIGVCNIEFSVLQNDLSMLSRDRNVSDSDFALVPPANSDGTVLLRRNEVQTSLFFVLGLVDALQDDVGFAWLCYGHHFEVSGVVADYFWELAFADFALEFGEVVALSDSFDFFFHLAVYPGLQAVHMDHSAAALAIAGRNQRVLFRFVITETDLAVALGLQNLGVLGSMLLHVEDSFGQLEVGVSQGESVAFVFGFDHHVLYSAHFDHVSRTYMEGEVRRG